MKKDHSETRTLSKNKKRWLSYNSKHHTCKMIESEADEFLKSKGNDKNYYFFKTLS